MKKIEAIIRAHKLDAVKGALLQAGVQGMTISEVFGRGTATRPTITYRGVTAERAFSPLVKIESVVANDEADRVIDAIFQSAHTGEAGDGQIMLSDLESVTRIRTGEVDETDATFLHHKPNSRLVPSTPSRVEFDVFRHSV